MAMKSDLPERAVAVYQEGKNCCEAVLWALEEFLQVEAGTYVKLGASFGGGLGGQGEICGAIAGAMMGLSARADRFAGPDSREAYSQIKQEIVTLFAAFRQEFGGVLCRDLTGYDARTPEGLKGFHSDPQRREKCKRLVLRAVEYWLSWKVPGQEG